MSRTNPRTVILEALQEGPRERWILSLDLHDKGPFRRIKPLLSRHLCKLIRSRRVVRLGDGRYALSNPWTRMLARCAKIDMDWRDFLPVPRNADAEAQDIARRHGMGAVAEARSIYSGKITIYLNGEDVGTVQVNPGDTPEDVSVGIRGIIAGAELKAGALVYRGSDGRVYPYLRQGEG